MQDNPPPTHILDIAIAHLRDNVLPNLDGRAAYDLRVTLSALELSRRSIALSPASDAAERARLAALLGQDGDLETLNRELCARITSGALDLGAPALAAHLRMTALEKLAVDQPTYSAYRRAQHNQ